ncbi:MAG TPA: hypothetical protein VI895_08875 [Bdellovibrionota bacterium]|nr:hypothetical protein [Bdellovibrionota bacterium]
MPAIARFRKLGILALLPLLVILHGCETGPYKEKELTVVVPIAAAPTATPARAQEVKEEPVTRERVRTMWEQVGRSMKRRNLNWSDIYALHPQAKHIADNLEKETPQRLSDEILSLQTTVQKFKFDRTFIMDKLERTRAVLLKKQPAAPEIADITERLSVISRLVEEEKYDVANEVLTEIQEELNLDSTARNEGLR